MLEAVLHLCWLNLCFPSTAVSIAPFIEAHRRRINPAEAKREFFWAQRLTRFAYGYDRYHREMLNLGLEPIPVAEAFEQYIDGRADVLNGSFMPEHWR